MEPPNSYSYRYADDLLGGNLAERLEEWRKPTHGGKPDRSYAWIAAEIARLTNGRVTVTHVTVRNWVVETAGAAS